MYAKDPKTGRLRWYRSRRWATENVEGRVVRIADRAEALQHIPGDGDASGGVGDQRDGTDVSQAAPCIEGAGMGGASVVENTPLVDHKPVEVAPHFADAIEDAGEWSQGLDPGRGAPLSTGSGEGAPSSVSRT